MSEYTIYCFNHHKRTAKLFCLECQQFLCNSCPLLPAHTVHIDKIKNFSFLLKENILSPESSAKLKNITSSDIVNVFHFLLNYDNLSTNSNNYMNYVKLIDNIFDDFVNKIIDIKNKLKSSLKDKLDMISNIFDDNEKVIIKSQNFLLNLLTNSNNLDEKIKKMIEKININKNSPLDAIKLSEQFTIEYEKLIKELLANNEININEILKRYLAYMDIQKKEKEFKDIIEKELSPLHKKIIDDLNMKIEDLNKKNIKLFNDEKQYLEKIKLSELINPQPVTNKGDKNKEGNLRSKTLKSKKNLENENIINENNINSINENNINSINENNINSINTNNNKDKDNTNKITFSNKMINNHRSSSSVIDFNPPDLDKHLISKPDHKNCVHNLDEKDLNDDLVLLAKGVYDEDENDVEAHYLNLLESPIKDKKSKNINYDEVNENDYNPNDEAVIMNEEGEDEIEEPFGQNELCLHLGENDKENFKEELNQKEKKLKESISKEGSKKDNKLINNADKKEEQKDTAEIKPENVHTEDPIECVPSLKDNDKDKYQQIFKLSRQNKSDIQVLYDKLSFEEKSHFEIYGVGQNSSTIYVYNQFLNKLEEINSFHNFPIHHSFVNIGPYAFISGGKESSKEINKITRIKKLNDKMFKAEDIGQLITPRFNHTSIFVPSCNAIFFIGGSKLKSVEKYSFRKKRCFNFVDMKSCREKCCASIWNDKYLYVFFGFDKFRSKFETSIEKINLSNAIQWEVINLNGDTNLFKKQNASCLNIYSEDKKGILIIGGVNNLRNESKDVIFYDPETNEYENFKGLSTPASFINNQFIEFKLTNSDEEAYNISSEFKIIKFNKKNKEFSTL